MGHIKIEVHYIAVEDDGSETRGTGVFAMDEKELAHKELAAAKFQLGILQAFSDAVVNFNSASDAEMAKRG